MTIYELWLQYPALWNILGIVADEVSAGAEPLACAWSINRWLAGNIPVHHRHEAREQLARWANTVAKFRGYGA